MDWFVTAFTRYATFSGRAGRPEYWYFSLIYVLLALIIGAVDGIVGWYDPATGVGLLSGILALALLLPSTAVTVRRLHDTGRSGWWLLIAFVPVIGWVVLLVFLAQRSGPGPNAYGDGPAEAV